jgi:hypothetical protein
VLGVLFALLALVPLAHTSPPDAMWIVGLYDAGDVDEVVWTLIGNDSVSPPEGLRPIAPPLVVNLFTESSLSPAVTVADSIARPRSPPRI